MQGRSILRSTLLLTAADLAIRAVSLLFGVYLADSLGAVGMGKMQLVMTAGGFAMTLGTAGVRVAAMNLTARECGKGDEAAMKRAICTCLLWSLCCSILAGALLFALSKTIALRFVKDDAALPALRLMAVTLPAGCALGVLSGYFTARGQVRTLVAVEIAERLLSIGITVSLLQFWTGGEPSRCLVSVIGGSSIATALSLAALLCLLRKQLQRIPSRPGSVLKQLAGLCIPLALSDYLRSGLSSLEQFLIPRGLSRFGRGQDAAIGDYGMVSGMVFPVLMFPAAVIYSLCDLLVPELSRCRAQCAMRRCRHIISRSLRVGFVFSALTAGILYLLASPLCDLLYRSPAAGRYLQAFAPMIPMLYSDALTDGMLKGLGEQVASVRFNTVTAAMDVALLFALLPGFGMGGFFFTFALSHGVNFALSIRHLSKVTGYLPNLPHGAKTILLAIFSAVFTAKFCPAAPSVCSMVLCASVFAAVFLLSCALTGQLHREDVKLFLPKRKLSSAV